MNNHPSEKSKLRSRNQMIQALMELMKEKAYDEITISDLCSQADLTRATFYRHFKSKDDVLIAYSKVLFKSLYDEIKNQDQLTLEKVLLIYFSFWKKHEAYCRLLFQSQLTANSLHCSLRFVKKGMEKIDFPQEINRRQLEIFLAGGLYSCIEVWMEEGMEETPEKLCRDILDCLSVR